MNPLHRLCRLGFLSVLVILHLSSLLVCHGQVFEKLFSFTEARAGDPSKFLNTGAYPRGGIIQATDGNYYGTTTRQNIGNGTIYRLTPDGALTTLIEFTGNTGANKGKEPYGTLIQGSDGKMYGTTFSGGAAGLGTLFRVSTTGVFATLVEFTGTAGASKGAKPYSSLIQASDGNFYGTTAAGGASDAGTIFRMTPAGAMTTVVEFTGTGGNGSDPRGSMIQGTDGNYYGTTRGGGASGFGTVFRMSPTGVLTTLVQFTGTGGAGKHPEAGLVEAGDGNLYGTTATGGTDNLGTVFRMTKAGVLTTLVGFTGNGATNKGSSPLSRLIQGSDGNLYGTTYQGGTIGNGTVYRMTLGGVLTTVRNFGLPGRLPYSELLQGSDGNFLGTTYQGGAFAYGTLFRMTPSGDLTTLVEFTDKGNSEIGSFPRSGVIQDTDGMLYGTTVFGGFTNSGTVYRMSPSGVQTTLLDFATLPGNSLNGGLFRASNGKFYGTTQFGGLTGNGTIFRTSPEGEYTKLVDLTGNGATNKGRYPLGILSEGNDGNIYGTTSEGGTTNDGIIFRMTPDGIITTLAEFSGNGAVNKGRTPNSGLVQDATGSFYGTTRSGGASNLGTVFKMTGAGVLTTLTEFTGAGSPSAPQTFNNGAAITINDNTTATPYPSDITVPPGIVKVANVRVVLRQLSHTYPQDTRFLLRSPNGTTCLLMAGAGSSAGISNVTVTLDDAAPTLVPVPIATGSYRPTPNGLQTASFTAPAPAGPYGTQLSVFDGQSGSGTWSLYVMDTAGQDAGSVAGGWSLELTPSDTIGSAPEGVLVADGNGNFFGTTSAGGTSNLGTIFMITPGGIMTTLVNFTGDGATNKGNSPQSGLVRGPDGHFYGTTPSGGSGFFGTIYRFVSNGTVAGTTLTTLVEFGSDPVDSSPFAALSLGVDGNLYGTTAGRTTLGGDGSVYRLVFSGAPTISLLPSQPPGTTTQVLEAKVNPRGSSTSVTLEYWTGGIVPPNPLPTPLPIASGLTGFQSKLVGTTLTGLEPGTVYYYRFRAESSAGQTQGTVATFSPVEQVSTLSPPVALSLPAANITPTSALLKGTVNARNFDSSVIIEWGTDPNSFPNKIAATPAIVTGNTPVPVSLALAGLNPGETFFYRIVATNAGGTVTSGTQSYRTLIPATATVTDATALSTTRAQVTGFVDAQGSSAQVSFEYGTDGINFPNSFTASPAVVSGDGLVEVTATLTGLLQGTTYQVRIRAQGPGGTGLSESFTFSLSILSGLVQVFPDPPPPSGGSVTVNFAPANVGAWRFAGDTKWLNSGVPNGNLAAGQRVIEFLPIPGFISPPSETVDVTGSTNLTLDRVYFDTPAAGSGALTVRLKPDDISEIAVPEANRAQWRIVGEATWRNSGDTPTGLAAGSYLVECKPVTGRETPTTIPVSIGTDDSQDITLTYFTANSAGGLPPLPKTFADVSSNEDLPFAHVGQIRTEVGSSTGFVVKRRVVATAGHVVFDDGTLSAVIAMQWFFQRHTGQHEPSPQIPRGYYLAAGYADQRILDNSPGEGSAQSQNLDFAALYFIEEAGRGGYGGFLASDSGDDNEFLNSTAEKILAGYPTSGIPLADSGKQHATAPFTPAFSAAFGETWTTTTVRGLGGMSGGPLFVRHQSGNYFPAAIYLGGAGQTVVRAIDSDVVELFLRAEVSGNGGDNNTDGGVTHTSVAGNLNVTQAGSLRVNIEPAGARANGASWQLNPEATLRQSGSQKSGLSAGTYNLKFKTIEGFQTPTIQPVSVTGGQLTTITFTYLEIETLTPLETWRQTNFGTLSNIGDAADNFDFDKDGETNIEEFTAGTDPKNSTDVFRIATTTKVGSTFTTTCPGKAGRTYTLLRNTTLTGTWTRLESEGPLASDGTVTLEDPSAPTDKSFYIIEVSIP